MAFIFVPNADGGFNEGDKQTNPDTGVEYIYVDGAWRALGPKIEDEFDTLDERYVNVSGDTMHGPLTFDHGDTTDPNFLIYPNVSNVNTSAYQLNSGTFRFRSTANSGTIDKVTTHIAFGKDADGDGSPQTYIYHLQDPESELHAANRRYVDNSIAEAVDAIDVGDINLDGYATEDYVDDALAGYLPLTGGELTGDLTIKNKYFYVENNAGEETFRVQPNGFCRTLDLFRSERDDGGPAFQGRIDGTLNAEIRCDGKATFKTSVKKDGKELATEEFVTTNALTGDFLPLSGGTLTGTMQFNRGNKANYQFKISPNSGTDFATNIYSMSNGQMRFRTSHTSNEGDHIGSHIVLDPANGTPTTKIYKVITPTADDMAANKSYVDDKVGGGRFYVQNNGLYYEMP